MPTDLVRIGGWKETKKRSACRMYDAADGRRFHLWRMGTSKGPLYHVYLSAPERQMAPRLLDLPGHRNHWGAGLTWEQAEDVLRRFVEAPDAK